MIDHIGLRTSNFTRTKDFYVKLLASIDAKAIVEYPGGVGFGSSEEPVFWIAESDRAPSSMHVAFKAASRAQVDAFYRTARELGAADNGAPGLRPDYHAHYYAAFVIDPDGNNIEAVCHQG